MRVSFPDVVFVIDAHLGKQDFVAIVPSMRQYGILGVWLILSVWLPFFKSKGHNVDQKYCRF